MAYSSVASATAGVLLAILTSGIAAAQQELPAMAVLGAAAPPPAFAWFCSRFPSECSAHGRPTRTIAMNTERWRELREINSSVNGSISELSDFNHYGVEEVWSIARDGKGDCEDFALTKRKLLVDRGWPSSALLVTVVRTPSGEGHAVLTIVTNEGDYVLDNKSSWIRLWSETGYRFYTRQSQANPRIWVAVGAPRAKEQVAQYRQQRIPVSTMANFSR